MVTLAGVEIISPSSIEVTRTDLTKSTRAASGKMNIDIITQKRVVSMSWTLIKDSDLKTIIDTINAHKPFFEITYPDVGGTQTLTVYPSDISATRWHKVGGILYWQNIAIEFTEQ